MTAPPLNITLSLGDVSFHLSPSSPQSSTSNNYTQQYSPAILSPSARRTTSSQYNNSRRRVRRTNNQQHITSPPIVSIRHGGSNSSTNHPSPAATNNIGHSPTYNNNSPLQNHIRGRVRAMKNKIEAPQRQQSPLFSTANNNILGSNNSVSKGREDEYCVDLNGFTGTLYITSRGNTTNMPQSTPQQKEHTTRWEDNRVLSSPRPNSMRNSKLHSSSGRHSSAAASPSFLFASSSRKRLTGDENVQLSNKRACSPSSSANNINEKKKDRFTWIASNSNDETVEVGRISDIHDENRNQFLLNQFEDTAATSITQVNNNNSNRNLNGSSSSKRGGSEKAVRFSMLAHKLSDNSMIPNKTFNIDSGDEESQTTTVITTSSVHQQQQGTPQQQLQPRQKSKHFFTSPPPCTASFTTSSPPRTALSNVLSETSSMLARSSKHMLKTVTLAGKDVMDQLSGENGPSSVRGVSSTSNRQSSNGSNTAAAVQLDSNVMNNANNDEDQISYDAFDGTELHYACASDSLEHVQSLLEYDTCEDLYKMDCTGKLPIHVLCENFSLISSDPVGCEDVALTMIELMGPKESVQALHPSGLSPFVYIIGRWTETLHRDVFLLKNSVMGSVQAMRISTTSNKVNNESITSAALAGQSTDHSPTRPQQKRLPYRSLFHSSTVNEKSLVSSNDRAKLLYLPDHVTIPSHVQWALRILSLLIDKYPEQCRESILTNIASVPLFLKSILLVSDTDEMDELLDTTVVKHCVMDKRSINVWLCSMLTADTRDVKMRATVFIKLISKLSLQDLNATSQSPSRYSDEEQSRFITLREEVFYAVYSQPGIVPAVLELGGRVIENISTTKAMRYITDKTIRKDSVFFVLILDFFYSIFLLMGYRLNVEYVLNYNNVDGPEVFRDERYISTSTMGIASYFLIKESLTLLSLYLTSTKLAKRYCFSIFKIIDVVSVAMLLATESILSTDPTMLDNEGFAASLTIILLWLKLMFAFKVLNSSFALFLYAVNEVIKESKSIPY